MEDTKPVANAKKEILSIEKILRTLLQSQEKGDIESFARCFLHNSSVVHIGTDIDEYFSSWRDYLHWIDDILLTRKGQEINAKETRIQVSADEKTAWYSQLIDTCYETKDEITRIEGFRHTGVLIKTPDGWKIVQSHVSAPIIPKS
ncbi:nuclear transport factor 2 family protein [Marinilabilia sp.]|uniref:nuclear transport factor 2 family protein n=1 Tax=Marinilabilia sp. TaxID=2021252 RepID=UPI0025C33A02|nr:nuclear transport factor 2 family protein [Marinilabilia sp.]